MPGKSVESDAFRLVSENHFGCCGRRLRHRVYALKANPDSRPGIDISHTVAAKWATAGMPLDAVFHLGRFHRVTDVTGERAANAIVD